MGLETPRVPHCAGSATTQHLGPRRGEETDEAQSGGREAPAPVPYRADVPTRRGVADRDLGECWVCRSRIRSMPSMTSWA